MSKMNIKYNIKYKSTNALGQEHIFDTYYGTSTLDSVETILENTTFNHHVEVIDDDENVMGQSHLNEAWYGTECSLIKVNIAITMKDGSEKPKDDHWKTINHSSNLRINCA